MLPSLYPPTKKTSHQLTIGIALASNCYMHLTTKANSDTYIKASWNISPPRMEDPTTYQILNTKRDHDHSLCWFNVFYHVSWPSWIAIHWSSISSRAQSHMASHYLWGSMTMLHDFGGVLGQLLDTFYQALTISWSWLLARVWSGPNSPDTRDTIFGPSGFAQSLKWEGMGLTYPTNLQSTKQGWLPMQTSTMSPSSHPPSIYDPSPERLKYLHQHETSYISNICIVHNQRTPPNNHTWSTTLQPTY